MDRREVKQRFSIRKYKLGAASVLLATVFASNLVATSSVSADEVEGGGSESQEAKGQELESVVPAEAPVTYGGEVILEPPVALTPAPEVAVDGKESTSSETPSLPVANTPEEAAPQKENEVEAASEVSAESDAAFRRTSPFRANTSKEHQVYSQSQMERIATRDNRDTTASASGLKGYMQIDGRTAERELVRWELAYTPTRVNGNVTAVPVGVQISTAANMQIVPNSVTFNKQSLSANGDNYYSANVKANINQANTIEFMTYVDRRTIDYSNVTVRMATDIRPNVTSPVQASATPVAAPNNRNIVWVTARFDKQIYQEKVEELEGPKDTTTTEAIPFATVYQADDQMEANATQVVQEGQDGEKTVVTTYTKDDQGNTVANRTETVVKEAIDKIVKVGTKSKVETSVIPFKTVYENDPNMKVTDPDVVVTEGKDGLKTVTVRYTLDTTSGQAVASEPVEEIEQAIDRVIKRGSNRESQAIPFTTEYRENKELEAGQQKVIQEGVDGFESINVGTVSGNGQVEFSPKSDASTEQRRVPQLIMVMVEDVPNITLSNVSVLAPLWDNLQDGDKLLWIKANDLPETFNNARASFSVKGVDERIKPLEPAGPITASELPSKYGLTPEEISGAELRMEMDRYTGNENSLINNAAMKALIDSVASTTVSVNTRSSAPERYRHAEAALRKAGVTYKLDDASGLLAIEPKTQTITTVVYKPLDIRIGDESGELAVTQANLLVDGQSTALEVRDGKIVAQYTPTSDTNISISYSFAGAPTANRTMKVVVTSEGQAVYNKDQAVTAELGKSSQAPVTKIVEVGTKAKVEVTTIAFETVYEEDPTMKADDPEVVVTEGKDGQKTVTTTYTLNTQTGEVTANEPTEETVAAVNRVVRRGVGQETKIPFETVYVANEQLEAGQQVVATEGVEGTRLPNGTVSQEPVNKVIQVGTKPKVEEKTLDYQVYYHANPERPLGWESVANAGVKGLERTTTTYTLNPQTGEVTANEPTTVRVRRVIDRVYTIGTMPKVEVSAIAFETEYIEDPSMLASDPEVVVQAGQTGQRVSTTNYSLDQATGQVTALTPIVVETAAVDQIIKRGTGQNTELPFETHYVADATLAAGEQDVRIQGQTGLRHPNGSITKEVVAQVVAVGTRPSQRTETVAFTTRYLEAKEMAANSRRTLVEGQTGQKTFTVTYVLNTVNGQVTAQPETGALTIQPVAEVIEVGTKPTMRTVELEFSIVYKEDKEMTAGQQVVDQEGQKGLDTYTTTYVLNVETGQVTAQPEVVERTSNPVARVVRVGVKPLVVETELGFETVYQDDPMMLPTDKEVVLVEGQVGKETRTTNYVLDIQTGQVTAQEPIVERKEAVNRLVKRGVGQTSPIAFKVIYKGDVTLTAGQRVVDQEGQEGLRHPNGSVLKEALDQIIRVGLKPVEKVEELPFEEEVIEDPNLPLGQICVDVEGQAGKRITRITYSLNPETGEVTAHESVETLAPVKRIVRKGIKVEEVCPPAEVEVSTPAPEAKILPNTGTADSAALLVAGGLAGLAGLGLAAKKREED